MNIEEAKKYVKENATNGYFENQVVMPKEEILALLDKLNHKQVVPQYVAEWVDKSREYDYDFDEWFDCINQSHDVYEWLNCENKRQAELNALAFTTLIVNGRDAVIVEEEKRYTVKIKGVNESCNFLIKNPTDNEWFFYSIEESNFAGNFVVIYTRKELEEGGFGWVFDCEGIEVK